MIPHAHTGSPSKPAMKVSSAVGKILERANARNTCATGIAPPHSAWRSQGLCPERHEMNRRRNKINTHAPTFPSKVILSPPSPPLLTKVLPPRRTSHHASYFCGVIEAQQPRMVHKRVVLEASSLTSRLSYLTLPICPPP